ncbi:hypothetical protein NDU88_000039 [Pleurodeles waltl]|uniref:Uncharacterized protein n=1 Tax=Pleurodeles waltl TaxID=8319 RepID=A0AAV7KPH5_PLEWA|nr:hypothetical protein NDU88_000039 [Pleurodeles waltl]
MPATHNGKVSLLHREGGTEALISWNCCHRRLSQFTIEHMAPASVWVIGHSFVRRAQPFFNLYRSRAQDAGLRFLCIARGGLRLDGLRQLIEEVLRRRLPPPALIILHKGARLLWGCMPRGKGGPFLTSAADVASFQKRDTPSQRKPRRFIVVGKNSHTVEPGAEGPAARA